MRAMDEGGSTKGVTLYHAAAGSPENSIEPLTISTPGNEDIQLLAG
jgi:hypothetical protein